MGTKIKQSKVKWYISVCRETTKKHQKMKIKLKKKKAIALIGVMRARILNFSRLIISPGLK